MTIRPVGAELFHADGQTDEQTWCSQQSLFAILRTRLKTEVINVNCAPKLLPILQRALSEKLRCSGSSDSVINTFYMYVSWRNCHFLTLHGKLLHTKPVIVGGLVLLVVSRRVQIRSTHVEEGLHVVCVVTSRPGSTAAPMQVHKLRVAVVFCSSHSSRSIAQERY